MSAYQKLSFEVFGIVFQLYLIKAVNTILLLIIPACLFGLNLVPNSSGYTSITYKIEAGKELKADLFLPKDVKTGRKCPVLVTFHGGGWVNGNPLYMHYQCKVFADQGFIAIAPEYRLVQWDQKTGIEDAVTDAKSIIRWVRQNAAELNANPEAIVVSGASAGGYLAVSTAMVKSSDDNVDQPDVRTLPNAAILFCPPLQLDNSYVRRLFKEPSQVLMYSPFHLIRSHLPPVLVFHGDEDNVIPLYQSAEFVFNMKKARNTCDLSILNGQGHNLQNKVFTDTLEPCLSFLLSNKVILPNLSN